MGTKIFPSRGTQKMSGKLKEIVILAGGHGSRLKSQGINEPKILLNINGTTLLENHLNEVKKAGLKKVIFLLGSGSDQILSHLAKIRESEVEIQIIVEEEPRGTTNAILSKIDHFSEQFILIYGDLYHHDVLKDFRIWCEESKNYDHAISGRWTDHPKDSNCFFMDDENLVIDFIGKKNNMLPPIYGMSGLAMLKKDKLIGKHWHNDFEQYLFQLSGQRVKAFISNKLIYDCGTVERINNLYKKIDSRLHKKKSLFVDRDGVLINFVKNINRYDSIKVNEKVVEQLNCIKSDRTLICLTNTPQIAKGFLTYTKAFALNQEIFKQLKKLDFVLDAFYLCPHHPDIGFPGELKMYKRDCDCRKPKKGMVEQALKELNIELEDNIYFGDTTRDEELARSLGSKYYSVNHLQKIERHF